MATSYLPKKSKNCTSESSSPSSPTQMAVSYGLLNASQNQNGMAVSVNNGNGTVNGQNSSESPSPGLNNNNNNAPKYGTPVPNRIFVGGISAQTTESELAQLFSAYGNVKGTKIIVDRAGVSKGYGFVTFETEVEARRIMRDAQCVMFKQRKLNIAPAIKKQPFSRSLEVQSPPIGIPSTVMYANGSPYMFHNGMAFFSPPEPTPNFQPAPASGQMTAVPTPAAAMCPTMMYPCPPGQPIYQYPYQPVPSQLYRGGQPLTYFVTSNVVSQDGSTPVYYAVESNQLMQYCDPPSELNGAVIIPINRPILDIDAAGDRLIDERNIGNGGNDVTAVPYQSYAPVFWQSVSLVDVPIRDSATSGSNSKL